MNERAFKLDFFLALAAVLLSVITTAALIYQTSVMRDQYAATVWPYLSVDSEYDQNGFSLNLTNNGFGPALVKSAALTVDGKAAASWDDLFRALLGDPLIRPLLTRHTKMQLSNSSVDASTIVRPGESSPLFKFFIANGHEVAIRHRVAIDLCYCSLNGSCWTLHATPGKLGQSPQPTPQCVIGSSILSPTDVFRLGPGRASK